MASKKVTEQELKNLENAICETVLEKIRTAGKFKPKYMNYYEITRT